MTGAFFMVQIVFLIETVAQPETEEVGSAEMGHEGKMRVNIVMQLIACGDFLVDVAFTEGNLVVFQMPAELEIIRQTLHGHDVAQIEVDSGQLQFVVDGDGVIAG